MLIASTPEHHASSPSISMITATEIEIGMGRRERREPTQRAVLRRWLEQDVLSLSFERRTWPVDVLDPWEG